MYLDIYGATTLTFRDPAVAGYLWAFRWQGDHVATLTGWLGSKLILVNNASSGAPAITYNNLSDGYTYIGFTGTPPPPMGTTLIIR